MNQDDVIHYWLESAKQDMESAQSLTIITSLFIRRQQRNMQMSGYRFVSSITIDSSIFTMKKIEAVRFAQQYVDAIKYQGIPLTGATLFGSYATGRADQWSDIDICLVSPTFKNRFDSRVQLIRLKHAINESIEPHPFTPEDIESQWLPMASEIQKYGIALKV